MPLCLRATDAYSDAAYAAGWNRATGAWWYGFSYNKSTMDQAIAEAMSGSNRQQGSRWLQTLSDLEECLLGACLQVGGFGFRTYVDDTLDSAQQAAIADCRNLLEVNAVSIAVFVMERVSN